jgi:hypothetical protein
MLALIGRKLLASHQTAKTAHTGHPVENLADILEHPVQSTTASSTMQLKHTVGYLLLPFEKNHNNNRSFRHLKHPTKCSPGIADVLHSAKRTVNLRKPDRCCAMHI